MAFKWTMRLTKAGLLLGGIYLIGPARGTIDANERLKAVVETVAASRIEKALELSPLEIATIQPTSLLDRLRVSGELEPVNQAVLRAKEGGQIIDVAAREGQAVKAGDVLLRFDTEDLQSILKQREADRDAANAEMLLAMQSHNRIEQLVGKNIAPQEQLDKVRSEVAGSAARLQSLSAQAEIARTALRDAEVLAPFDGVVSNRVVNHGSQIGADTELLTVVDTTSLEAKVLVSTRDIHRVAVGQTVELQIDGLNEQLVIGRVARISPVADGGTRFVPVHIRLANHDGRLRGGMFATGSILIRQNEGAIVVPAISLWKDKTGDYVLRLENGLLVRQAVTIGPKWNGGNDVEISEGLAQGDRIVTVPLPELRPNVAVTISRAG